MVYEPGRKVLMLVADKWQLDRRVLHEAATLAKHNFRVNIVSLHPDVCQPTNLPPMPPAEALRYNERTASERANSRLKEDFGDRNVMVEEIKRALHKNLWASIGSGNLPRV